MIHELLNSSSDSYYLNDEPNPRLNGQSRRLFAPNTTMIQGLNIVKAKLKKATRRANFHSLQAKSYMFRNQELEEANKEYSRILT